MHGFALNVMLDVTPFGRIVPCGIADCRVTSMAEVLGRPLEVSSVRRRIAEVFAEAFGLAWTAQESDLRDRTIPACAAADGGNS